MTTPRSTLPSRSASTLRRQPVPGGVQPRLLGHGLGAQVSPRSPTPARRRGRGPHLRHVLADDRALIHAQGAVPQSGDRPAGRGQPPDDARLDPLRSAGIATVVNCAVPTDGPRPAIGTLVHGSDGELITTYWKQHLYEHERGIFTAGDRDGRFELGGLRFALATCFDNHFPDLTARGAADGCQVHLASSLYGTGNGIHERATLYPGIAKDFAMHVVLANHVGPSGPWIGCGGAALWAPGGALLAEADDRTTTVAIAEIA